MTDTSSRQREGGQAGRCPYCQQNDCVWFMSTIEGAGNAEVRTDCGEALSADALLARIRWHLEAGNRALQPLRAFKDKAPST